MLPVCSGCRISQYSKKMQKTEVLISPTEAPLDAEAAVADVCWECGLEKEGQPDDASNFYCFDCWEAWGVLAQTSSAVLSEEGQAELKVLFDSLDEDGDGKVTIAEWGKAVAQNKELLAKYFGGDVAAKPAAGSAFSAFKKIDVDNSGALDWAEFIA